MVVQMRAQMATCAAEVQAQVQARTQALARTAVAWVQAQVATGATAVVGQENVAQA